jgi:hypothetical protein
MGQVSDANVVRWPGKDIAPQGAPTEIYDFTAKMKCRLEGVLALVRAVEASETLAEVPACELARMQHHSVINLLLLAERELIGVCQDLS